MIIAIQQWHKLQLSASSKHIASQYT